MKKMRKLIPALSMLLIATIMLSTATFAWFTMNESVTASGMEIQAKASGNLLISTEKMTAADQGISINLIEQQVNKAKKELVPVTGEITNGVPVWKIPSTVVDPVYGTVSSLKDADGVTTFGQSEYFSDYTFYLATAGDALTTQYIYINLVGLVGADQNIAPAYTIAFYVEGEYVDTVNYEDYIKNNGKDIILGYTGTTDADKTNYEKYTKTFTIPSTYGKTADDPQGLKVEMRVYVDGALLKDRTVSEEKVVNKVSAVVDPTEEKFLYDSSMADWKFYKVTNNKTVYTSANATSGESKVIVDETSEIDQSQFYDGMELNGDWYVWDGEDTFSAYHDTAYVNNNTIPTGSTKFSVTIGVKEAPAAPEQE